MTDSFWRKFSHVIGLLPIGALFGLIAYVANVEIKDLDLWLHIAMGRYISLHHFIPSTDILSCTIAGKPWVNHEWLFQVIVYNVYHLWGVGGLLKLQTTTVIMTMLLLLFLGYNKDKQLVLTVFLCLVYLVFQQRFTHRPDIFSLLFFTFYIFVLALHIDKKWSPWVLFIVQVLWANIHGFFFFGPLFILIGLFSEWLKRHVPLPMEWNESGRLTDEEYQRLKFTFLVVVAASFINPYGIAGAIYPLKVFFTFSGANEIFFDYIQELQKPIHWDNIFSGGQFIYYKLIILLSFVSFVFNRSRIDVSALFFWLVFLVFSLQAARNVAYFGLAAYLVFITNAINISMKDIVPLRFTHKKFQHITSVIGKLLLLMWVLQYAEGIAPRSYYDFDKYDMKSEFGGVSLRGYPYKAAQFLTENDVKGNFFNDFNSGAYLLGMCYPNIKVYIDGRTEVYGGDFFKQYLKIWEDGDRQLFDEAVEKYNITGVLLNSARQMIPEKILRMVYDHKEWKVVYFDYDAIIFLKDNEANKGLISKFGIDLKSWEAKKLDLYRLGPVNAQPFPNYYRAFTLETLGIDGPALAEIDAALKANPSYSEAYQLRGKIFAKRKDYEHAFEDFRIASYLSPYNKKVRSNLALAYYDLNQLEGAIKQYQLIVNNWGEDPAGYFLLARAYAKNSQFTESVEVLNKAVKLDPKDKNDVMMIGDIAYEQNELLRAKEIYGMALSGGKDSAMAYEKIGKVFQGLGDLAAAKEAFQKALVVDPGYVQAQESLKALPGPK